MLAILRMLVVEPLLMGTVYGDARMVRRLYHLRQRLGLRGEWRKWRARKEDILRESAGRRQTRIADLGLGDGQLSSLESRLERGEEVVLADVDQDGFFLSQVGPLPGLPAVAPGEFLSRRRYQVQLVAKAGWVGVKKNYRGHRRPFLNELRILHKLNAAGCRVPAIIDIDFDAPSLTIAFVQGDVLRERLAQHSALVRDRDVAGRPDFRGLSAEESLAKRIESGAGVLDRVVDRGFVDEAERALESLHRAGVAWADVKYGNVLIDKHTGLPWLVDFEGSIDLSGQSCCAARALKDADWGLFNRHFRRDHWTYRRVRQHLRSDPASPLRRPFYASACVGYGIWFGRVWGIGAGWGRWEYMLRDALPPLAGKRVLDLGSNNGANALQMLRSGAREVVAVECDREIIRQGEMLRDLCRWADDAPPNLRFVQADMAALPELDLGRFDVVTALCSLYYLGAEDMRRVTRFVSTIADTFAVQGNHATDNGRQCRETYEKARIEYLQEVLQTNGFGDTEIVSLPHYPRPVLIGRRTAQGQHTGALHAKAGSCCCGR